MSKGIRFANENEPATTVANAPKTTKGRGIRFARGEFQIGKKPTAVDNHKQFAVLPGDGDDNEASIHELLAEFDGAEALRFHKMGYSLDAARYEHRQMMQRRPTTERRLVRI